MILCEFVIILSWKRCCVSDHQIVCASLKVLILYFCKSAVMAGQQWIKEGNCDKSFANLQPVNLFNRKVDVGYRLIFLEVDLQIKVKQLALYQKPFTRHCWLKSTEGWSISLHCIRLSPTCICHMSYFVFFCRQSKNHKYWINLSS